MEENLNINKSESSGEQLQLVGFKLSEEDFGVDIIKVQEIIRMVDITRVPNTQYYVVGVINLRGKVIPIIDMRRRLDLKISPITKESRIVVVEVEGKVVGFIVDSVSEVIRLDKNITEPPPPMVSSVRIDYITAIAKLTSRLLILLDLEVILQNENSDNEIK